MTEHIYDDSIECAFVNDTKRERIVRCRDCRYYEPQTVSYSSEPLSVCTAEWCEGAEHDNPLVEPDGFCAWGEREIWTMCKCGEEIELGNREFAVCPSCGRTVRE